MQQTVPPQVVRIQAPGSLLGRLLLLTMLGFLAVVMIGPLIAILSAVISVILSVAAVILGLGVALLPFALIGLLVWGAYQAAAPGQEPARAAFKQRFKDFSRTFGRFTVGTCRRTYQAMRWTSVKGLSCLGVAGRGVRRSVESIRQMTAGRGRALARMGLEISCGAILATGVCLALSDGAPEAFPVGIIGGAILGAAIGWSRPERSEQAKTLEVCSASAGKPNAAQ